KGGSVSDFVPPRERRILLAATPKTDARKPCERLGRNTARRLRLALDELPIDRRRDHGRRAPRAVCVVLPVALGGGAAHCQEGDRAEDACAAYRAAPHAHVFKTGPPLLWIRQTYVPRKRSDPTV